VTRTPTYAELVAEAETLAQIEATLVWQDRRDRRRACLRWLKPWPVAAITSTDRTTR
jgi:hypothetical protein